MPADIAEASKNLQEKLDYNFHVRPILSDRCYPCHGPDQNKRKVGLRLDIEEIAKGELPENPGHFAIVEGNLDKSQVFHRILSDDPEIAMPLRESNLSLTVEEKAIIIKWIEQGAEYKPHWAFIKPEKMDLPQVDNSDWPNNEIDHFILQKIEAEGLEVSPEASQETLIRRATFDLTGLPPTLGRD